MRIFEGDQVIEILDPVLAEDLLIKWGYKIEDYIEVKNLYEVASELSVWGVPCKWNF